MSEWKQERVRARLARQGAEDRVNPPAKRKSPDKEWLVVEIGSHLVCSTRTHTVWTRHHTEEDARRHLEKWRWLRHTGFVVSRDLWERIYKPLWR